MAKVPFSKLGIKINEGNDIISWNDQEIEVYKYLPIINKTEMITRIINLSITDTGYYNPLRIKIYTTLEIVYNYTNINFTAKQKEDIFKLYDLIVSSGLYSKIISAIPQEEWNDIEKTVWDTIKNIYEYKNSAMGILEAISQDYSDVTFDLESLQSVISDPASFGLLKQILPMLQGDDSSMAQNN